MNKEQLIKDYEQMIINLSDENKKLKMQLYSKDQVFTTCPNCGEKFLINQCRVVSDLQDRINKSIRYIEDTQFEAFDGMNEYEIEQLLDTLKGRI